MPHSTQNSTGSVQTFDLTIHDGRPETPRSGHPTKSRSGVSSGYGLAVTSASPEAAIDQRTMAPSQQDTQQQQAPRSESGDLRKLRRRSTPGTAEDYAVADMIAQRGKLEELVQHQRRPPGISDGRSQSYNDTSKRRTQYYEEQFQYKENTITQTKEKVQRQTPVIAELKTNVIVSYEIRILVTWMALTWLACR